MEAALGYILATAWLVIATLAMNIALLQRRLRLLEEMLKAQAVVIVNILEHLEGETAQEAASEQRNGS